jgi:hypothetical protein
MAFSKLDLPTPEQRVEPRACFRADIVDRVADRGVGLEEGGQSFRKFVDIHLIDDDLRRDLLFFRHDQELI